MKGRIGSARGPPGPVERKESRMKGEQKGRGRSAAKRWDDR
jgi:hypothetical protein